MCFFYPQKHKYFVNHLLSYLLNVSVCGFPHVVILNYAGQRFPRELKETEDLFSCVQ